MNILKLAAQILLFYILYRLIVNFIIPTYRSMKRFRKQFDEVQQRMKDQYGNQTAQSQPQPQQQKATNEVPHQHEGEYIEFEEVKD